MAIAISKATPGDAGAALSILIWAAEWLRDQGIQQWGHYLDGSGEADLLAGIGRGEVYLVRQNGQAVATISLQPAASEWDQIIWGPDDGQAAYVHRLAIDRTFAGQGLGDQMLDWAEAQSRALGKRYLRLDCVGQNERLNRYYSRRFAFKGQGSNIGMLFSRYERDLRD